MRHCLAALFLLVACLLPGPALAQGQGLLSLPEEDEAPAAADSAAAGAPVRLLGDTLFLLYAPLGPNSAAERAQALSKRLRALQIQGNWQIDSSLTLREAPYGWDLLAGDRVVHSLTAADAKAEEMPLPVLARTHRAAILAGLAQRQAQLNLTELAKEIGLALLDLGLLTLALWLLNRGWRVAKVRLRAHRAGLLPDISLRGYTFITGMRLVDLLIRLLAGLRMVLMLILIYTGLTLLFSIFPWTRELSDQLLSYVLDPLAKIGRSFITYLPNLLTILVVLFVTRYALRVLRFIAREVEQGDLDLPGFYADWAKPTYGLIRFITYVFVLIVIFPYLPGSDSPFFRGISVFVGVLISLGSSGAIGNVVAGLMLTYTRAFQLGDRVTIGTTTGDVVERTLLVTRLRTIKNVDVTIPNGQVLSGIIENHTHRAADKDAGGVILHTRITIGYDVPWQQVHKMMIQAALLTDGIEKDPTPFVLQTSLQDFYVEYEINGYTRHPERTATIYSQLHQNIQDAFYQNGVEILSPHYRAMRDGTPLAMPPKPEAPDTAETPDTPPAST